MMTRTRSLNVQYYTADMRSFIQLYLKLNGIFGSFYSNLLPDTQQNGTNLVFVSYGRGCLQWVITMILSKTVAISFVVVHLTTDIFSFLSITIVKTSLIIGSFFFQLFYRSFTVSIVLLLRVFGGRVLLSVKDIRVIYMLQRKIKYSLSRNRYRVSVIN